MIEIKGEFDVVLARQRARQIAQHLGFDAQDQVRIATAVSEIVRNAFQYGGGGRVEFQVSLADPRRLRIRVQDQGPGIGDLKAILDGRYVSRTGMGLGIAGARRLMDDFKIESTGRDGTNVLMGKAIPDRIAALSSRLSTLAEELARVAPTSPFEEMQRQNQDLLRTLDELRKQQGEQEQLNAELEETNRGVVALYAELDEKAESLRRASDLKSRFLSNMSHEFRTPLNSIDGLSQLLLSHADGELSSEQEHQVTLIRNSARTLLELVNDLLDLAKVEAGKVEIRPGEFQISALFSALRGMLRPLISDASVSLVFDDVDHLPVLVNDESKIAQILRNFLSNALKFTETGEVRACAATTTDGWITFSVTDTGVGIAEEDQATIFEEFAQIDGPHQRRVKGTGLGLPLSRSLATLLGGKIGVRSELGKGSTFTLTVPRKYAMPTAEGRPGPTEPPGGAAAARSAPALSPVLAVDGDPRSVEACVNGVRDSGFEMISARNCDEARAILRRIHPVAVILNIMQEVDNSWVFLTELKSRLATKDIPVIVLATRSAEEVAVALGADDVCLGPPGRGWLLERLTRYAEADRRKVILLIDDNDAERYVLKEQLGGDRYEVVEAVDGGSGLAQARQRVPDAIFLDLVMPDMSGFDVLRVLKEDAVTQHVPVIIHTSSLLTPQERERLTADVAIILSKEITMRGDASGQVHDALIKAGVTRNSEKY